jgi:hypothetical protein
MDTGASLDLESELLLLSTYWQHWRLRIDPADVTVPTHGGVEEGLASKGGNGVPPDAFLEFVGNDRSWQKRRKS